MQYQTLNDVPFEEFDPGRVEIWYARFPSFRDGEIVSLASLSLTHACLGRIRGVDDIALTKKLEYVFSMMQGENWSPRGEARSLIEKLGLSHTSMSVGDVVRIGNEAWKVCGIGWEQLS